MSQSSSTFSSEIDRPWRYLVVMAASVCVVLVAAVIVSVVGFRNGLLTWHFSQLMQYQFSKIDRSDPIDILLVGDSSLGNAVDAKAWSKELKRPVMSLALTGAYGYGGSLNMIRRMLRRQTPKTIIIFNTVKLMNRDEVGQGALFTAERWSDLDLIRPSAIWNSLINLATPLNVIGTIILKPGDRTADYLNTDYVPQGTPLSRIKLQPRFEMIPPTSIVRDHERFLAAIGAICAEHNIQCLYVHGPLGDWACLGSVSFVAAVNEVVSKAKLSPIAATPVCIPWQEIGDAEDHVLPQAKSDFSSRYLSLIAPKLK